MKLIAIEGNISAGKSTLLESLVRHLNAVTGEEWKQIVEPVDSDPEFHRLLKQFISNPDDADKRIEFQMYLTNQRSELLKDIPDGNYIIERSLFSDLVFSHANFLTMERPSAHYMSYYYDIKDRLKDYPQVDLILYLDRDPVACFNTAMERDRDGESGYTPEYFVDLHKFHKACLPQIAREYSTGYREIHLVNRFPDAREVLPTIMDYFNKSEA